MNNIFFPSSPNSPFPSERNITSNYLLFANEKEKIKLIKGRNINKTYNKQHINFLKNTGDTFYTNKTNNDGDSKNINLIKTTSYSNKVNNRNKSYISPNLTFSTNKKFLKKKKILLNKETEAKNFLKYLKNHFAIKEKEKSRVNLYNFVLDKNKDMLKEKMNKFRNISGKVKDINEKSKFLNIMTSYINPIVERIRDKKINISKKKILDEKYKILENKLNRKKYCISLDRNTKNFIRVSTLYKQKYEIPEIRIENLRLKNMIS
jgi:hypothetical protein